METVLRESDEGTVVYVAHSEALVDQVGFLLPASLPPCLFASCILAFYILASCLLASLPLLPIGSLFRDPGPYRDLFANLGPYWVFISLKRSLFLPFCHFEREKDKKYLKSCIHLKKVKDNFFRGFSSVLNFKNISLAITELL